MIGVDVGGPRKGFHAVVLQGLNFTTFCARSPREVAEWCQSHAPAVVAIDSPCLYSVTGKSRRAERELNGQKIHCFSTPTLEAVMAHTGNFYGWVRHGAELYAHLKSTHTLFDACPHTRPTVCETFPHAVVCVLRGQVVAAKSKGVARRQVLRDLGFDVAPLRNIDLVDAALCAVAARGYLDGQWKTYGDHQEGFIVVPTYRLS